MDLIERYLGAVRWNLPAAKANDIVAELADLIAARIEDREETLDRPLSRTEVSALLKEFGHPLAVAGQYHGQRSLIGPEVFPFYWFVLRVWLAVVAVIEAIEIGGRVVLGSRPFMQALMQGMNGAAHTLLFQAAIVTLAFAVIERMGWLTTYLERWKPEELPELPTIRARPVRRRSQLWESVFGIAFSIAFLAWWSGSVVLPLTPHDARMTVHAAPIWNSLYWPVVALVWIHIVQNLVMLVRPAWKPARTLLILTVTGGTIAIAAWLHGKGALVIVAASDAAETLRLQEDLDRSLAIALMIVPIVVIVQAATELWKLYRAR